MSSSLFTASHQRSTPPITDGRLLDFPDDPIGCMLRLRGEHGDLCALREGNQQIAFAFGPEYNQLVLSDTKRFHSRFFAIRGGRRTAQRRLSSGLLSMNGDEHRSNRRMIKGPFQKSAIGAYDETTRRLVDELLEGWATGDVVDVNESMLHFMLKLTSAILFGLDVPELALRIGEKIDRWVHLNHETGMGAFISSPELTHNYERLLEQAEDLEADLVELIDRRRRGPGGSHDVLSLLLRAYEHEGAISDEQLSGHVALLFGAAHLTTAHTLTWTLFLLSQHPDIAAACHEEALATLEGGDLDGVGNPAIESPLIERVVKESMRLLPASAYVQRMCAEPVELGPLRLERGTPVVWSQFVTHHMPELFPDPERFDPDRWLTIKPSPYAYLPFGAGHRMCIGAALAMRILTVTLPALLANHGFECVPGTNVEAKVVSTTFGPEAGLPMRLLPPGTTGNVPVGGNVHDYVRLPGRADRFGTDQLARAA